MCTLKRILRPHNALLIVLFTGFLAPVFAQSQQLESLTATAKGHGKISSEVEEREISSALIVLRQNGTFLVTVTAEIHLQAEGTWKVSASSPDEILLNVTGGVLKGEMTGSGKLFLTDDRKIRQLAVKLKTVDGAELTVNFAADDSKPIE